MKERTTFYISDNLSDRIYERAIEDFEWHGLGVRIRVENDGLSGFVKKVTCSQKEFKLLDKIHERSMPLIRARLINSPNQGDCSEQNLNNEIKLNTNHYARVIYLREHPRRAKIKEAYNLAKGMIGGLLGLRK